MARNIKKTEPQIKSWYLGDELSGVEQPKKENIQKLCEYLKLPFNRETAIALIYGDTKVLPERIFPVWLNEIK